MSTRPLRWYLWRGVSAGILVLVALLAALVVVVPAVAGAGTFTITGRSMEPTLPLGTLVVTRPVEADQIAIGDIVTFQLTSGEPAVATHRVVGVGTSGTGGLVFVTRGDANAVADAEPILAEQVRGRVWYSVPVVGWVNYVLAGPVRAWLVPAAVAALCGYAGWMFVGAYRERRRSTRASAGAPV